MVVRSDSSPAVPAYRGWGWGLSAALHLLVLLGLLIGSFREEPYGGWGAREARVVYVSVSEELERESAGLAVAVVTDVADVTGPMVRERIEQAVEEAVGRSDQENLDRLDRLAGRLGEEGTVDQLARSFHSMLGTSERAGEPATEPVGGEFDPQTAQFHDVRREVPDGQTPQYYAILIDAQGRTIEVAMEAAEGERMYALMRRIKDHPLLERVYRRIAMPLLDQLLAAPAEAHR